MGRSSFRLSLDNFKRVLSFLSQHLRTMIDIGAPIWPLETSVLYHLWAIRQLPSGIEVVVVTWGVSTFSVGFLSALFRNNTVLRWSRLRCCDGRVFDRVSSVATFAEHLDIQPHREAEVVREAGWEPTIDMCSAAANAKLPRFISWTDEAECEQVDCFAARTWSSSLCPSCEKRHTECGWYFPPSAIVEQCVQRALSDGAWGFISGPYQ